jgi:hypothetical protein
MEYFEFRFDDGNGAVCINFESYTTIDIDYRFMLNNEDVNWDGHYRSKIQNDILVEEFLNKGIDCEWAMNRIKSALNELKDTEKKNKINTAYQNKLIKTQYFN